MDVVGCCGVAARRMVLASANSLSQLPARRSMAARSRRNNGQAMDQLDDEELLQAADRRPRERLRAAMAGTGVQLSLAERAG